MALNWEYLISKVSEVLQTGAKGLGLSVCVFACTVCVATQPVRYSISIFSFHQYTNSFCKDMYDAEMIMIKQEFQKNKHWIFKITKWEQREILFST